MLVCFWRVWQSDYLSSYSQRRKWYKGQVFEIGQLVLIEDTSFEKTQKSTHSTGAKNMHFSGRERCIEFPKRRIHTQIQVRICRRKPPKKPLMHDVEESKSMHIALHQIDQQGNSAFPKKSQCAMNLNNENLLRAQ